MKSATLQNFWLVITALLLTGCGPAIKCNDEIDGASLLKTLYDTASPTDKLSNDVITLTSSCEPSLEQKKIISDAVSRIAKNGSATVQSDFYNRISASTKNTKLRTTFIKESSLFNGLQKSPTQEFNLVEFNNIGQPFNKSTASPALLSKLQTLNYDLTNADSLENLRVITTNNKQILLALKTDSYTSAAGFPAEKSEFEVFDFKDGMQFSIFNQKDGTHPIQNKNSFNDYLYEVDSLVDTRYAIDKAGHLKYIIKASESAGNDLVNRMSRGDDLCTRKLEVSEFNQLDLKENLDLSQTINVECDRDWGTEHHDPFQHYPEKELLAKLASTSAINLVDLINFNKKDEADNELRKILLSQGDKWHASFKSKIPTIALDVKTRNVTDSYKYQLNLLNIATQNISLLKWVFNDTEAGRNMNENINLIAAEINRLKLILNKNQPIKEPIMPTNPFTDVVSVSIALARQIMPNNGEGIPVLNEHPYTYFGVTIANNQYAIIRSHRPLAEQSSLINVTAHKGVSPIKYWVGQWMKDVWNYSEVTDDEKVTLNQYYKDNEEYKLKLKQYFQNEQDLVNVFNQLTPEIENTINSVNELSHKI